MDDIKEQETKLKSFNYHMRYMIENNIKVLSKIIGADIQELNYLHILQNNRWIAASNTSATFNEMSLKKTNYKFSDMNIGMHLFIEEGVIRGIRKSKRHCTVVEIKVNDDDCCKLFNTYRMFSWFVEQFIQRADIIAKQMELIIEQDKTSNFGEVGNIKNVFKPRINPALLSECGYREYSNCMVLASKLSFRERECLSLFKQGFYAGEMAKILVISRRTIENHKVNAIEKLKIACLKPKEQHKKLLECFSLLYAFEVI